MYIYIYISLLYLPAGVITKLKDVVTLYSVDVLIGIDVD